MPRYRETQISPRIAAMGLLAAQLLLSASGPLDPPRERPGPRFFVPPPTHCAASPVLPGDRLVAIVTTEGASLSRVAVGSVTNVTTAIDIVVRADAPRTALLLGAVNQVVYRFRGATDRIASVTVASDEASGVVGLPASRVRFRSATDCDIPADEVRGLEDLLAPGVKTLFGRRAAYSLGAEKILAIEIGRKIQVTPAPARNYAYEDTFATDFKQLYPGPTLDMDPRKIVSDHPAARYRMMPRTAGILQQIGEGSLQYGGQHDIDRWFKMAVERGHISMRGLDALYSRTNPKRTVRVMRTVEAPGYLCGNENMVFVVAPGARVAGDLCGGMALLPDGRVDAETTHYLEMVDR